MSHNLIHRGLAKKKFKENTLQAFKYCFKKKFGIETDLHVTKDGKIICFHDFNLKKKFKLNKYVKNLTFGEINKIAKKFNYHVPELKELIKISKNKHYLMLEIKSIFSKKSLKELIYQTKKLKFFSITSFNEKNIKNLYKLKKKLNLGVVFASTTRINKIIQKSKLAYINILVMEKKFLLKKKLNIIKKPIYFYTARNKEFKKKYKEKNLIFEIL
jgi:glycerophosphoryl diester phosphodiesterase